jgi:hypothetical protein
VAIEHPWRENQTDLLDEVARVIKPGGTAYLEKRSRFLALFRNMPEGYKGIGTDDIKYFRKIGFEGVRVLSWGVIPGRFWSERNRALFQMIEGFASLFGFGIRKVLVAQKGSD